MAREKYKKFYFSRRDFLKTISWTPAIYLTHAPFHLLSDQSRRVVPFTVSETRLTPRYPTKSPLDDLLLQIAPGSDEYVSEKYAYEITDLLNHWSGQLTSSNGFSESLKTFVHEPIEATSLIASQDVPVRSANTIQITRRKFSDSFFQGRDHFLQDVQRYLASLGRIETAEFLVIGIDAEANSGAITAEIRYDFVGLRVDALREERIGRWRTRWIRDASGNWRVNKWEALGESVAQVRGPGFVDITAQVLGGTESYRSQMLRGADDWRTVLDGACGIDVYGNNGVAVGDFDSDGLDDLYVCQPSGLPNRLYRNRRDGTFEDVTESAGVGVLDGTACALFADFSNRGLQDLLVVCATGPLLFLNQGRGKFQLKRDVFKFAQPPEGTFTHAAVADYDNDGRLDIYFCLYSYYLGLDQYHYPTPYFDAQNGPPNFLFHNEGDGTFVDRTAASGLNAENDRYSFACAWGDLDGHGAPDLYVANDFGRNNLYRNNGDGTFTAISEEAHIQDVGAGMSACWLDYDNDGKQDIYVSNMWSAAGLRVSRQNAFHAKDSDAVRARYRQHARGNSLYRNLGNGKFENVSLPSQADVGRWAWSSDSWDLDHDGHPDVYCVNGYISGPNRRDLSSFFWRHVVAASPSTATPSPSYEQGWSAINESIRSDLSWSGYERNVCFVNNRDGTFSDVAGALGLDSPDDSRSFVLADIDHDGHQEIILKNRNGPQLRVLRNTLQNIGDAIVFRLHGEKSNRDAIGAAVTVESGDLRQTKYLQAGSGFLAQHSKEMFVGLGKSSDSVRATIRWPSGRSQTFDHLPRNQRVEIREGATDFVATPFCATPTAYAQPSDKPAVRPLPDSVETWLLDPLSAPGFSLPDAYGKGLSLQSFQGAPLLLCFWTTGSSASDAQIELLRTHCSALASAGLRVLGINGDDPSDPNKVQAFAKQHSLPFPVVSATADVAGVYNIIFRYLFDRRRDLPLPTSFLIDDSGKIVKVYQGIVDPQRATVDVRSMPRTPEERIRKALPFPGLVPEAGFQRNDFTYGVALFQRGYLDQAEESFKQVVASKPSNAEAYYNLGTLYLRRKSPVDARRYLEQAINFQPNYPEAWNNLGMIAAQEGHADEAIRNFQRSLQLRPNYAVALVNLGNLYRRQGNSDDARKLFTTALEAEPNDPEANYSLGMVYAHQDQLHDALRYLEKAVSVRPDYADALNNLGVLYIREQRYPEAEARLKTCIRVSPNFDQAYLNLARLYVLLHEDDRAKEVLHSLLQIQPDHKMAQQALEMLH
jgi:tetratricopeptide (TPR) repeat protein/peroxiredoxin